MIDGKHPILIAHEDGRHWMQLSFVEDIKQVLRYETLTPADQSVDKRAEIVGVPVMIDRKGEVWPKPAKGWTLWRAEPMDF